MLVTVNGKPLDVPETITLSQLVATLGLDSTRVAVERNRSIIPKADYVQTQLQPGDELEIVTLVGGGSGPFVNFLDPAQALDDLLVVGGQVFTSRLMVGTGKYASFEQMAACLDASGTDCVTVAVRRVNLDSSTGPSLLDYIDRSRYTILPNTAGCYTADDAVRYARLAREVLQTDLVKLEVLADEKTLLPEPIETLSAVKTLVSEGFKVLCYTSDDPVIAKRIEEAGAVSVMPAGSPIGSGQGVLNANSLAIILEQATVPIICDAGVGTASDVAVAMELGCAGVLLNTAIAKASDPLRMAHAMRQACQAGRLAYLAGRIPRKRYATASSPMEGMIAGSGKK